MALRPDPSVEGKRRYGYTTDPDGATAAAAAAHLRNRDPPPSPPPPRRYTPSQAHVVVVFAYTTFQRRASDTSVVPIARVCVFFRSALTEHLFYSVDHYNTRYPFGRFVAANFDEKALKKLKN